MNSTLGLPLALLGWIALAVVAGYVLYKVLSGIYWSFGRFGAGVGWLFRHVGQFIARMVGDVLHLAGRLLAAAFYFVLSLFSHGATADYYHRAMHDELVGLYPCLYRLIIGHLAHLLLLSKLTEGIEQRVPEVVAGAPHAPGTFGRPGGAPAAGSRGNVGGPNVRPSTGGTFDGYRVIGTLQPGGSGARLYLAEPDEAKRRQLAASGRPAPAQVVIKSFSLEDGSTLPQIVRENRALVAARDLGLVLEHELTSSRFHYVMPYVPGEDLATVTARLHAAAGPAGLDDERLRLAIGYATDLLATLDRFHHAGLWHKDVKPGNIIVSDGHVHLVDLGLITPLRSAMTLTTHGTEYFRDPEMVRLALKGVKVHEVDGAKFDIYGAGAVLYSLIENGFPAHGSLSRLTRRCPEALALIVRRAMADMSQRYGSAQEMLADLQCVAAAPDPFALRPADLPSFSSQPAMAATLANGGAAAAGAGGGAGPGPGPVGGAAAPRPPAADIDPAPSADQHDGWFGRRRRWRPVRERAERPRRSGRGLLFVCILVGLFFSGSLFHGSDVVARRFGSSGKSSHLTAQVDTLPAAPAGSTASQAAANASTPSLTHANFQILAPVSLDRLPPSATVPPAAAPAVQPLGTILVIDDLPANATAERRSEVEQLCTRLRSAPYALLGVAAPNAATAETEVALLAGARAAVGLADPSDEDAIARLTTFLRDQGPALDAVLWIGRGDGSQPVHTRAIARNDTIAKRLTTLMAP